MLKEDLEVLSKEELVEKHLELKYELEQAQKAVEDLAAVTVHDINNPLTVAIFNIQALMNSIDDEKLDFGNKAYKALNAMERIREIVKNLSSRANSSKEDIEVFDLNTIISEEVELLRGVIEKEGAELTIWLSKFPLIIEADKKEVKQIIVNLLNNAKYAQVGPLKKQLRISSVEIGKYVGLEVVVNSEGTVQPIVNQTLLDKIAGQVLVDSDKDFGLRLKLLIPKSDKDSVHSKKAV